ncbi:hypothetical protein ACIGO6_40020 [Streptomyces sp. NPDC053750]|uniref:hypothetical protein n=1 Tax=Streptomyces sp. NPDC053750 TaxID=3365714 RepID=UPI0037D7F986
MRWPDEIREPSSLTPPPVELSDEEIDGALALMDTMTRDDLEGDEFRDTYTEAVAELIEAKREHREPPATSEPAEAGQLVDLMAALNESVVKAKAGRGDSGYADVHALPKKRTAKKTPAKKTTAKKTTTRKPSRSA